MALSRWLHCVPCIAHRDHWRALLCWLAIPPWMAVMILLAVSIDPEWARRTSDYATGYRLIAAARDGAMVIMLGGAALLGVMACAYVLRARQRGRGWLLAVVLGPIGLFLLALLRDRASHPVDAWQRCLRRLGRARRMGVECGFAMGPWLGAWGAVALWRDGGFRIEAWRSGVTIAAVAERHAASGGMQAFADMLLVLYLVPLAALAWPLVFNLLAHALEHRRGTGGA